MRLLCMRHAWLKRDVVAGSAASATAFVYVHRLVSVAHVSYVEGLLSDLDADLKRVDDSLRLWSGLYGRNFSLFLRTLPGVLRARAIASWAESSALLASAASDPAGVVPRYALLLDGEKSMCACPEFLAACCCKHFLAAVRSSGGWDHLRAVPQHASQVVSAALRDRWADTLGHLRSALSRLRVVSGIAGDGGTPAGMPAALQSADVDVGVDSAPEIANLPPQSLQSRKRPRMSPKMSLGEVVEGFYAVLSDFRCHLQDPDRIRLARVALARIGGDSIVPYRKSLGDWGEDASEAEEAAESSPAVPARAQSSASARAQSSASANAALTSRAGRVGSDEPLTLNSARPIWRRVLANDSATLPASGVTPVAMNADSAHVPTSASATLSSRSALLGTDEPMEFNAPVPIARGVLPVGTNEDDGEGDAPSKRGRFALPSPSHLLFVPPVMRPGAAAALGFF